jgi:hypothetical protein
MAKILNPTDDDTGPPFNGALKTTLKLQYTQQQKDCALKLTNAEKKCCRRIATTRLKPTIKFGKYICIFTKNISENATKF